MTCEWSHWIMCHDDECQEHQWMKKRNQYYSQKFWNCVLQDKEKWSKKSLYEALAEWWQWVRENHNHKKHEKIEWKECTDNQC